MVSDPLDPAGAAGEGCAMRTGFLSLRRCRDAAIGACGTCGRPVCVRHAAPHPGGPALGGIGVTCTECATSKDDDDGETFDDGSEDGSSREWSVRTRTGDPSGSSPAAGEGLASVFDANDRQGFARPARADATLDAEPDDGVDDRSGDAFDAS